jgi:hypothetical protein
VIARLVVAAIALSFFSLGLHWWYEGSHPGWGIALDMVSFIVGAIATARRADRTS